MNTYNFIEEYKIPLNLCDQFIEYHKNNNEYKSLGVSGVNSIVNPNVKDSIDVTFFNNSKNKTVVSFFKELSILVKKYMDKYNIEHSLYTYKINLIQHYKKNGGYKKLHYERASLETSKRQLVYMLYCNTLKNGGTYFPFQNKTIEAVKGKLIIWPSDFTHPHKGVISKNKEKYIVTGWFEII